MLGSPRGRSSLSSAMWVLAVLAVLALPATLLSCTSAREAVPQTLSTVEPGVLLVGATVPTPGFWEGEDPADPMGGYEWGLAQAIAAKFNLEVRVLPLPFAELIAGGAEADVFIAQIEPTPERRERFDFSVPYLDAGLAVLVPAGEEVKDLATAKELRWVVVEASTAVEFLNEVVAVGDPVEAPDEEAAAAMLLEGDADAALMDLTTALVIAGAEPGLHVSSRFVTETRYAIALPRGSANRELIDAALRGLSRDGSLGRLATQWLDPVFERPISEVPVIYAR